MMYAELRRRTVLKFAFALKTIFTVPLNFYIDKEGKIKSPSIDFLKLGMVI